PRYFRAAALVPVNRQQELVHEVAASRIIGLPDVLVQRAGRQNRPPCVIGHESRILPGRGLQAEPA
ncbi:MAG: hypothetical protein OEM00_08720, partial [Burkholderiaceae bacterium]|nr:hypothetical protein [Burkholderiaceae bacterium]